MTAFEVVMLCAIVVLSIGMVLLSGLVVTLWREIQQAHLRISLSNTERGFSDGWEESIKAGTNSHKLH